MNVKLRLQFILSHFSLTFVLSLIRLLTFSCVIFRCQINRNNEKRKEKSRDAARCRRSRETEIFTELGDTLPVRKDELENLDKSSVMRLAIATLKIEDMLQLCESPLSIHSLFSWLISREIIHFVCLLSNSMNQRKFACVFFLFHSILQLNSAMQSKVKWRINCSRVSTNISSWKLSTVFWLFCRPTVMLFMYRRISKNILAFSRYVTKLCIDSFSIRSKA